MDRAGHATRLWGPYGSMIGDSVTRENQPPDAFGQYRPAFADDEPPSPVDILRERMEELARAVVRLRAMQSARKAAAGGHFLRDATFHRALSTAKDAFVLGQQALRMAQSRVPGAGWYVTNATASLDRANALVESSIAHPTAHAR